MKKQHKKPWFEIHQIKAFLFLFKKKLVGKKFK